jgi:hypothetical protein
VATAVRQWWPVPAFLAVVVAVQVWWIRGDEVTGHAASHFASAPSVFAATFFGALALWAASPAARRRPAVWILVVAFIAVSLVETVAAVRVVDAIGGETWTDEQAAALGPGRPGFESAHHLADLAGWWVKGVGLLLAVWLWRRGELSRRAGIVAVVVGILVLPWMVPGLGAYLAAAGVAFARARRLRAEPRVRREAATAMA